MPFGNAQSLTDEVYAITAYVLHLNDVLKADDARRAGAEDQTAERRHHRRPAP